MKRETKSVALFDDGSKASNFIRLHFQRDPGFAVTRVSSREELLHRMKERTFDIVICPATGTIRTETARKDGNAIWLRWSIAGVPKGEERLCRHPSFLFEVEARDALLSYHTSPGETVREQFAALSRLLVSIERHHSDFARFQTDTAMLQSIVENSLTGIMLIVRNRIQWANHESLRILGRTERDLVGSEFCSLFPDNDHYREFIRKISGSRDRDGWSTAMFTPARQDASRVACAIRIRRLNPMDPRKGYLVFLDDNEERRHLEQTLGEYQEKMAKNEARYLGIMHQMDHAIIRTDLDGRVSFWNRSAETTLGYPAGEANGKNLIGLIADTGSRTARDMSVLLCDPGAAEETPTLHVLENRTMGGGHAWIAWNTLVYRDSGGSPAGVLWIGQDISDLDRGSTPGSARGSWRQKLLEGTDIREEIFDTIFHAAVELGRGGRESRKVGTSFVIGDSDRVMEQSRQCSMNVFEGKRREQRMVQAKGNIENLKNLALIDGAFVIGGDGFIHASSRHLLADTSGIDIPEGYGTRHASVAAMTKVTRSVGIVISESGGTVTIFRDGRIARQISP